MADLFDVLRGVLLSFVCVFVRRALACACSSPWPKLSPLWTEQYKQKANNFLLQTVHLWILRERRYYMAALFFRQGARTSSLHLLHWRRATRAGHARRVSHAVTGLAPRAFHVLPRADGIASWHGLSRGLLPAMATLHSRVVCHLLAADVAVFCGPRKFAAFWTQPVKPVGAHDAPTDDSGTWCPKSAFNQWKRFD